MIESIKSIQLDIMLIISGLCLATAVFMTFSKTLDKERKVFLVLSNIFAVLLLVFDRYAYIYRGDISETGFWMVRISNFVVFIMTLMIDWSFNHYVIDIIMDETDVKKVPFRLKIIDYLITIGIVLVIISQFTGLYYTFDETNHYQRAPGFLIGAIIPVIVLLTQLTVAVQYRKRIGSGVLISLILFTTLPIVATLLQLKFYGLSLITISTGLMTSLLYLFVLNDMNQTVERARNIEVTFLKQERERISRLFAQTAEALASAIDAKDKYTKGHSSRVAEYSRKIAEMAGKEPQECEEIYYAALLHDVGKIGVPRSILNKAGKLSDEEFQAIKEHPSVGEQILSSISESPYLSLGAKSHHERYDGHGYPEGLKGDDIPEYARIIAVADAYDAMTSNRSYRDTIPQQLVREEFVKGLGTQFDPEFGEIMLHLIDVDTEYQMKEKEDVKELAGKNKLSCEEYRSSVSEGIIITNEITRIELVNTPDRNYSSESSLPSIVLFDSLDARIHDKEKDIERLLYFEYGEIRFDGNIVRKGARKMQINVEKNGSDESSKKNTKYTVEAVKVKDHVLIRIISESETYEITVALPDSTRWVYIGLTGEHCEISDVSISREEESVPDNYIKRIAEEISYIAVPQGDCPNIQADGFRTATTDGILLEDKLTVTFHTMSLPTARLVWHCPYFIIFYSRNGKVNGPDFREYGLIRLDGENWASDDYATNKTIVNKTTEFINWDTWKENNKAGFDVSASFERSGNNVTLVTKNKGIEITNITKIADKPEKIYIALTGDQSALTNIRIKK